MSDEPPTHPVYGTSGLTDAERHLLIFLAVRRVAGDLVIDEQEAADLLAGYAERGDPCRFVGNQLVVAVVAAGVEVVRADRAWLRAVATSDDGTQN